MGNHGFVRRWPKVAVVEATAAATEDEAKLIK